MRGTQTFTALLLVAASSVATTSFSFADAGGSSSVHSHFRALRDLQLAGCAPEEVQRLNEVCGVNAYMKDKDAQKYLATVCGADCRAVYDGLFQGCGSDGQLQSIRTSFERVCSGRTGATDGSPTGSSSSSPTEQSSTTPTGADEGAASTATTKPAAAEDAPTNAGGTATTSAPSGSSSAAVTLKALSAIAATATMSFAMLLV